jgi:predicted acetyltransferase
MPDAPQPSPAPPTPAPPQTTQFGPIAPVGELDTAARLVSLAFGGPQDGCLKWLNDSGTDNVRVLRDGGSVKSCLLRIPMAKHFGGRPVPLVGIAGVAVGPESRGRGYAAAMMAAALREMAAPDDGTEPAALSGLYASTQTLYRKFGYEQAGHNCTVRLRLAEIDVDDHGGSVEPLTDADTPAVEACYLQFAQGFSGTLARGPYIWNRLRTMRGESFTGFGVREAGTLTGYLFLTQRRREGFKFEIGLSDLAFTTPAAGRRLLAFLRDFRMVSEEAVFTAGPAHPLLTLLAQQRYTLQLKDFWMLRIVDLKRAVEARGYAPGTTAELHLHVDDPTLPSNAGNWLVKIAAGSATAERAGRGDLRLRPRALASLYSGFLNGHALALAGLVQGPQHALNDAAAAFSFGGPPWCGDQY